MRHVIACLSILLLATPTLRAQNMGGFLRLDDQEKHFQTSIVTYSKGDVKIDLVSVVHIGEKDYFKQLNNEFEQYDSVLYELVAPEGAVPDEKQKMGTNPISLLQNGMRSILGLDFQLSHIDYKKSNFVHADFTPTEMKEFMNKRGESTTTMLLDSISHAIKSKNKKANEMKKSGQKPQKMNLADFVNPKSMRLTFAKQMTNTEGSQMLASSVNSLIIDARNTKAMQVLGNQISKGNTNVAIFYGGAHMSDFAKRLEELGFEKGESRWINAWNIKERDDSFDSLIKQFTEESIGDILKK